MKRLVLFVLAAFSFASSMAANPTVTVGDREIDSVLYAYFQRCSKISRKPEVLATADTLFRLAGEKKDVRMQAAALSYRVDFYYYNAINDSLFAAIERGKSFCRANKQFTHYYFIWGRKVSWYMQRTQYRLAFDEILRLLEEARSDDFKPAVGNAYQRTGDIFMAQSNIREAIEQYEKAVAYYRENDIEIYNATLLYNNLFMAYLSEDKFRQAEEALDNADRVVATPQQRFIVMINRANLYRKCGELEKARELLARCVAARENGEMPSSRLNQLAQALSSYYVATGEFDKAQQTLLEVVEEFSRKGVSPVIYSSELGQLLFTSRALNDTATYFHIDDIFHATLRYKNSLDVKTALSEFSTLLDVNSLNRENAEMELEIQRQRTFMNGLAVVVMAIMLLLTLVFLVLQRRTNRRLKRSRRELQRKNLELTQLSESEHRARKAAEQALGLKQTILRNITHEIRTPLNAISGFCSLLQARIPTTDQEAVSYAELVGENSRYLSQLIDNVLTLSDMEQSSEPVDKRSESVDAICRRSMERVGAFETGVELRYTPPQVDSPLCVETNSAMLSCVLYNLLDNARKFTEKGHVELGWSIERERLVIWVADTGCGIEKLHRRAIFDHFYKVNPFKPGMGIGLTVCRIIVGRLGGEIRCDDTYTGGARFEVRLPLAG